MYSTLGEVHTALRACRRCVDAEHPITPGAVFSGTHQAQVMIIGQAPGVTEVEARRPFNAGSGRRLFEWLGAAGWSETVFRQRHYMTAVTKCFPGKHPTGKGDRVPSKAEQALCRGYLDAEVRWVSPRVIIPVGRLAIELFFPKGRTLRQLVGRGVYLTPDQVETNSWFDIRRGRTLKLPLPAAIASAPTGRWIVPLPHPSGASLWPNRRENRLLIDQAIALLAHIRTAWALA